MAKNIIAPIIKNLLILSFISGSISPKTNEDINSNNSSETMLSNSSNIAAIVKLLVLSPINTAINAVEQPATIVAKIAIIINIISNIPLMLQ